MFQLGGDFVLDAAHRISFLHRMRNNGDRAAVGVPAAEWHRAASTENA
jgi:hypothetical protein